MIATPKMLVRLYAQIFFLLIFAELSRIVWCQYTVTKAEEVFRHPEGVPPDQSIPVTEDISDIPNENIHQQYQK